MRGIGGVSNFNYKKETIILILALFCVMGFTQNAYGDNLIGNLGSATVDAGDSVTVSYKLQETSANQGDSIDGCNAGVDGDTIVVAFNMGVENSSPEVAGITFVPSTITYDHCSTNDRIDVLITTSRAGVFTIQPIISNIGLGGSFQTQPATTVLTVIGDTIPPVIAPHNDEIHEATSAAGRVVLYTPPSTSDNVDPPGISTCSPPPGQFPLAVTTVTCNASDLAGNVAIPTTFTITVRDTTPPETTIGSAIDIFGQVITADSTHLRHSAEFTFSGTDVVTATADLTYECSLDSSPFSSCTSPHSFIRLPDGDHTFSVAAIDLAGNKAHIPFTWTINTASVADTLDFDQDTYSPNSNLHISITDFSNLTPIIAVTLKNERTNEEISIDVSESGIDNGDYRLHGFVRLSSTDSTNDNTDVLNVAHRDTITASYSGSVATDSAEVRAPGAAGIEASPTDRAVFNQFQYTMESGGYAQINLVEELVPTVLPSVLKTSHPATIVEGQSVFTTRAAPATPTAASANTPKGVAFDGCGNLWIVDSINNRVLMISPTITNGKAATVALGQASLTAKLATAPPTISSLNAPRDIAFNAEGKLFIADSGNHRILLHSDGDANPATCNFATGQAATSVLGQSLFTTNAAPATPTSSSLNSPRDIGLDNFGNLYAADSSNHRILRYDAPFTNGEAATLVLGQSGFTTKAAPATPTSSSLNTPRSIILDAFGNLYAADQLNHRILRYDAPLTNGEAATLVLGQSGFTTKAAPAPPTSSSLNSPRGLVLDSHGTLMAADTLNNRVLQFLPPFSNGQPAFVVIGQSSFTTSTAPATASAINLKNPRGMAFHSDGTLYVADSLQHRTLGYVRGDYVNTYPVTVQSDTGSLTINAIETGDNTRIFATPSITFSVSTTTANPSRLNVPAPPSDGSSGISVSSAVDGAEAVVVSGPPVVVDATAIFTDRIDCVAIGDDDNDLDGLCNTWEDQSLHDGLVIPYGSQEFVYATAGGCKPQIDDISEPGHADYGPYSTTPLCPDPNIKDIFWEIDYLAGHKINKVAVKNIVEAFANAPVDCTGGVCQGIRLHVINDENLGFHTPETQYDFESADPTLQGFKQLKLAHFGTAAERSSAPDDASRSDLMTAKRQGFHYTLIVHKIFDSLASAWAEILGNDSILSFGILTNNVGTLEEQQGTFMHEIGHNLGLRHSGNTDLPNCEGNYLSRMNYLFQMGGVVPGVGAPLDFSRFSMDPINENNLNDAVGVRPNSIPLGLNTVIGGYASGASLPPSLAATGSASTFDWNRLPDVQSGYSQNVHYVDISDCRDTGLATLTSYDDWSNVNLVFQPDANFLDGVYPVLDELNVNQVTDLLSLAISVLDSSIQDLPDEAFNTIFEPSDSKLALSGSLIPVDSLIQIGDLTGAAGVLDTTVRDLIEERIVDLGPGLDYQTQILTLLGEIITTLLAPPGEDHGAPGAGDLNVETAFNTAIDIQLFGSDPDNTPLTFVNVGSPSSGTLDILNPGTGQVRFTPAQAFVGTATFQYQVVSGGGQSNVATVYVEVSPPPPTPVPETMHLDSDASNSVNLFLNTANPTGTSAKFKDSTQVTFKNGNQYKPIGTWKTAPNNGFLQDPVGSFTGWVGLITSNDQGTKFDIKAELTRDGSEIIASGEIRCVTNVVLNPAQAKQITISLSPLTFEDFRFDPPAELQMKLSTRVGTNPDNSSCGGKSQSSGLRMYFDSTTRDSKFGTTFLYD